LDLLLNSSNYFAIVKYDSLDAILKIYTNYLKNTNKNRIYRFNHYYMTYKLNTQKILFTQLGDEGVLYDTQTNEYISLNETLFKILKGVEDSLTNEQIVENLCDEYRISEENCKQEVMNALSKLMEKEYIIE
jgi:hypothetical protein